MVDERFGLEELLARLRFSSGQQEKALIKLEQRARSAERTDVPLYLTLQRTRYELLSAHGRLDQAEQVKKELCAVARKHRAPWWIEQVSGVRDD